jgi:beta-lactamase class A
MTKLSLFLILVSSQLTGLAQSPSNKSHSALDGRVRAEVAPFKGKVSLFARNLDTGETYSLNGDERVRTASTIKIAVMIEAFARVAEGHAKWTDELVLTKESKVSGSGILQELSDGLHLSLRDCVNLMMLLSDNTATNLVLDRLTTDAVNDRMEALGFKQTRIMRKIGSGGESREGKLEANKRFGLGATSPHEMVDILTRLDHGEIVNPAVSKEMLDLMKREQSRYAFGRTMWDVPMATKSGALDRLRSHVGIIYAKQGKVAMAITVDDIPEISWSVDNPAYLLMNRLSMILINGLGASDTSSQPTRRWSSMEGNMIRTHFPSRFSLSNLVRDSPTASGK